MEDILKTEDKFVIRNSKQTFLIMIVLYSYISFLLGKAVYLGIERGYMLYNDTKVSFPAANFLTIFLFVLLVAPVTGFVYSIFKFFDNTPVLILTKEGLWHSKCGFTGWQNVWYVTDEIQKDKDRTMIMIIKLREPEVELRLISVYVDCNFKTFLEKINYYKGDTKVIEMIEE